MFEIRQQFFKIPLFVVDSSFARDIDIHIACRDGDSSSARRAILYSTPPGKIVPPRLTKKSGKTYHFWKVF